METDLESDEATGDMIEIEFEKYKMIMIIMMMMRTANMASTNSF